MNRPNFEKLKDLRALISASFTKHSSRIFFKTRGKFRNKKFSYSEIYSYIKSSGVFFPDIGVYKNDKVMLIGPNSPELATLILSCFYHNRVVVLADVRSSKELLQRYIKLTDPKIIFTTRFRTRDISEITKKYLVIEDFFDYLKEYNGKSDEKISKLKSDALAEIIFTSGTTGKPKGVMLTHKNIVSNLESISHLIPDTDQFEALSLLPLSHMYEQIIGLLVPLSVGARVCYVKKVSSVAIKKALEDWNITHLAIVPQVLKNLYKNIENEAEKENKKNILEFVNSINKHLPYALRKFIFRKVHKELGGRIQFIITGGAKLDYDVGQKWENMGFPVIEGYGATEVTAGATGNRLENRKLGSVGYALPKVEIKIDKNDEVLIKGKNVSLGYYQNKVKTRAVFTKDGWYRSGDMGKMIDGRLYLLGRDDFKIVLSSGENVYVEDLESQLNQEKEIWESCVINLEVDGREKVHAVIIPAQGFSRNDVENGLKRVNNRLEQHQQIVSHSFWTEEDFPRTHTLKTDRRYIKAKVEAEYTGKKMFENKTEIKEQADRLISMIAEVSGTLGQSISDKTNLGADLNMDSIDRVELIALLEDEFNVTIDDYAISAQTNVKDLRQLINASTMEIPRDKIFQLQYFKPPFSILRTLFFKFFLLPLHSVFVKTEIEGKENLPNHLSPVIYAFNHIGPLDLLSFLRYLPTNQLLQTASAGQENLWNNKSNFFGFLLQFLGGAFPVSPDQAAGARSGLERIGKLLDNNISITLAPEGRMTRTGKMQKFKRGIGVIASEMDAPIIPIKLEGDYTDVFRVPQKASDQVPITYFLPKLTQTNIKVKIGKPLHLTGISYNLATEIVEDAIRKL
ncbi:AMP-binding protein [Candidatus Roizmanbacteria bacterium]|nr:AMP-binding protein [Candidatus Roizmanbacteria bacterium]